LSSLIAEKLNENEIRIEWDVNSTGGADITRFTVSDDHASIIQYFASWRFGAMLKTCQPYIVTFFAVTL